MERPLAEVYPPGTKVQLHEGISGIVIAVQIEQYEHVTYRVSWWNGRARCTEWLERCELDGPYNERRKVVGFSSET